jgi:hypothetical protein
MNPWFDERAASWLGGILGAFIGIWGGTVVGGLTWLYIRMGWKKFTYSLYILTIFAGVVLAAVGLFGLLKGQPSYVWRPFVLCGGLLALIIIALFPAMLLRFKQREEYLMQIHDL